MTVAFSWQIFCSFLIKLLASLLFWSNSGCYSKADHCKSSTVLISLYSGVLIDLVQYDTSISREDECKCSILCLAVVNESNQA